MLAEFGRGSAKIDEVIVRWGADHLEPPGGVVARLPLEIGHGGVLRVGRAVALLGLPVPCRPG